MPKSAPLEDDPLWYKDDYLQDLGVTTVWVRPCPSPWRDDGYDISDYTNVHPACGTLRDFQAFLREAHSPPLLQAHRHRDWAGTEARLRPMARRPNGGTL